VSQYLHKSHNVSVLLYHIVCPAKYRKAVFTDEVSRELKVICQEIAERYEVVFLEIGADKDHVHFLVQSMPMYSPTKIVTMIKSITAKELFKRIPSVKKQLWGGALWSSGYFITTVGKHGSEQVIQNYVRSQGGAYQKWHHQQGSLFNESSE
jgi:putative transposase